MGVCSSCCCPSSGDKISSQALLNKDGQPALGKQDSTVLVYDPNSKQKPFRRWIELAFYAFAGSSKHAKKQGIYMSQGELQLFLDSVSIHSPSVSEIFGAMDSDISDGRITINEFVDYFCNVEINPNCVFLQEAIEANDNWLLLQKALRIFDIIDLEHKGYLVHSEFVTFGHLIKLTTEETNDLWQTLDHNNTGSITIDEMFAWYRSKYLKQDLVMPDTKQSDVNNNYSTFNNDINSSANSSLAGGAMTNDDKSHMTAADAYALGTNANVEEPDKEDKNEMYYSQGKRLGDYMKEHLAKHHSNSLDADNGSVTRDYDSASANSQE